MGEGRLWERLRIYSGKYLFNKSKFYFEKFLNFNTNFSVAFLLSLPQCEPMARTGPVKFHTIISYFYAYNILCFIRFTYLIGSGISQSKDEYIHI